MLSSAGVTSRIDRLERRGLVRRLPDPDDRRGVIVELTDQGLEVVDAAVAALAISDRQLLERLDAQEIAQLEATPAQAPGRPRVAGADRATSDPGTARSAAVTAPRSPKPVRPRRIALTRSSPISVNSGQ